MIATCFLYIGRNGSVRVTKALGDVREGEVAAGLSIEVPDDMFDTPDILMKIKVKENKPDVKVAEIARCLKPTREESNKPPREFIKK